MTSDPRTDELRASLGAVESRIINACNAARRRRDEVTLIVVTKFFPAADVLRLHSLGVRDIGENRDQEASAKVAELPEDVRRDLTVHFIGQLQSNKARHVTAYADVVHSVDRAKVASALSRGALDHDRSIDVLLQVDLQGTDAGRGGVRPDDIADLANHVVAQQNLTLRGVMAVAPLGGDPAPAFRRLQGIAEQVREIAPSAHWISAGMSGDLEQAVAHGATHLRVGSAILGSRPDPR